MNKRAIVWVDQAGWLAVRHLVAHSNGNVERIQVHEPGEWDNDVGPGGYYAISDSDGIFAYAANDTLAEEIRAHFAVRAVVETIYAHASRNRR